MPRPTTSAVEPRASPLAASEWMRYQRSLRKSHSLPDCVEPGVSPAELWIGIERPRRIIYTTKLAVFRWLTGMLDPTDPLLIYACGGLPSAAICGHVRATQGFFKVPVFFFGDLDPGDLTVLLALGRGHPSLRPTRRKLSLRYLGIGDRLLTLFHRNLDPAKVKMSRLDMSPDELRHFEVVRKMLLNIGQVVGAESLHLLELGKKIELEGLLRWAREGTKLRAELRSFLLTAP